MTLSALWSRRRAVLLSVSRSRPPSNESRAMISRTTSHLVPWRRRPATPRIALAPTRRKTGSTPPINSKSVDPLRRILSRRRTNRFLRRGNQTRASPLNSPQVVKLTQSSSSRPVAAVGWTDATKRRLPTPPLCNQAKTPT